LVLTVLFLLAVSPVAQGLGRDDVMEKKLSNGLRVLLVRTPDPLGEGASRQLPRLMCRLFLRCGSRLDSAGREGTAHLCAVLTGAGSRVLGTRNFEEETPILEEIDSYQATLERERIPLDFLQKLRAVPLEIRRIQKEIQKTLRDLEDPEHKPVSKDEMERLRDYVRRQESRIKELGEQLVRLKSSNEYFRLETRNALRAKIDELKAAHRKLIVPDGLRAAYARAGALDVRAEVTHDYTCFAADLPVNRFETFLWIESDRLQNAVFRCFTEARELVRREGILARGRPRGSYLEELEALAFLNHPYSRPPYGFPSALATLTRAEAADFYRRHYSPRGAVLVFVGDIEPEEIFSTAADYFEFSSTLPSETVPVSAPPPQAGVRRLDAEGIGPGRVDLIFRAPAYRHETSPVVELIAACLALREGPLARVLVHPPKKSPLATRVEASYRVREAAGLLHVTAWPAGRTSTERLGKELRAALAAVRKEGLRSDELSAGVNRLQSAWGDVVRTPARLADALGRGEMQGGWKLVFQRQARIPRITREEVARALKEVLAPAYLTMGTLGKGE
jgi:predicted Zn-dependent peptidase